MSDVIANINAALAQAPGSTQTLDEALRFFFSPQYSYYRDRALLTHPSIQDPTPWLGERKVLEHLAGGPWTAAFLQAQIEYLYNAPLLVRGFVDAPWSELASVLSRYPSYGCEVLAARTGDDPAALLALREKSEDPLVRSTLLCAAIASSSPVSDALIAQLDQLGSVSTPLLYRAFVAMGAERASRWVAARIAALSTDPNERFYALMPLFNLLGAPLDRATNDQLLGAYELFATIGYHGWRELGQQLGLHHSDPERAARELASRAAASDDAMRARWLEAMHVVLYALAQRGAPIDPSFDAHLDAAVATATGMPGEFGRILWSIGAARAEPVLDRAWQRYTSVHHPFTLLLPNFSEAYVQRLADTLVAASEDKALLDMMPILEFSTLGAPFVAALQRALAEIKPKKTFVTKLCKKLEPSAAAAFEAWLETRPAPKKSKKK